MLTSWESKTRYIKNYTLERRKIDKALVEIRKQLEIYMEITEQEHNEDYSFEDNHMEPENH